MVAHDDKFRVLRKLPEVRFEEELRGYSKSQVDRVLQGLAPLADDVAVLQQRLADAEARTAAAEARLLEASSARRSVPEPVAVAPVFESQTPPASFDETLSKTLLLAQRTADQTVAAAQAEASELLGSARIEADQLKAENARARRDAATEVAAERHALMEAAHREVQAKVEVAESSLAEAEGAQRQALVAEIADYTTIRDQLGEDIERLEGHLAQRREVIRAALADIGAIVDDPTRLHSEMPPVAAEPVVLPVAASDAVVLDVTGLDDLAPGAPSDTSASDRPTLQQQASGSTKPGEVEPDLLATPVEQRTVSASASLLGEVGRSVDQPTEAVPMVHLLRDDDSVDSFVAAGADDGDQTDTAAEDRSGEAESGAPFDDRDDQWMREGAAEDSAPESDHASLDLDLDDWGTTSPMASGAVIVDEVSWNDAPVASASPADFGFEDADDHVPSQRPGRAPASDELGRPAWAEAVPDIEAPQLLTKSEDPFLDELRRATGDDAETDVALERFLTDNPDEDDRRSGWFSRRK